METISTEDINQITSLVDGLTSEGVTTGGNTLNTVRIENTLSAYTGSRYTRIGIIITGLVLWAILRTIKEKIRANIRAKTFEKRAIKTEKKEVENKSNQEEVIKNIFNGIK